MRVLFREHYDRQRRLLNVEPAEQAPGADNNDFLQRGLIGQALGYAAPHEGANQEEVDEHRRNQPLV